MRHAAPQRAAAPRLVQQAVLDKAVAQHRRRQACPRAVVTAQGVACSGHGCWRGRKACHQLGRRRLGAKSCRWRGWQGRHLPSSRQAGGRCRCRRGGAVGQVELQGWEGMIPVRQSQWFIWAAQDSRSCKGEQLVKTARLHQNGGIWTTLVCTGKHQSAGAQRGPAAVAWRSMGGGAEPAPRLALRL